MLDSKVRYLRIDGTGTHSNRSKYVTVDRFEVVSTWGFEDKQGMESELAQLHGFEGLFLDGFKGGRWFHGFELGHTSMDSTHGYLRVCSMESK